MAKKYLVWLEIEEHDEDTDKYTTLDAPGSSLRQFDDYDRAWEFCAVVQKQWEE